MTKLLTGTIGRQMMNTSISRSEIIRPMCLLVSEMGQCILDSGEPQFAQMGVPQPRMISRMKINVHTTTSTAVILQMILKGARLVGEKTRL